MYTKQLDCLKTGKFKGFYYVYLAPRTMLTLNGKPTQLLQFYAT